MGDLPSRLGGPHHGMPILLLFHTSCLQTQIPRALISDEDSWSDILAGHNQWLAYHVQACLELAIHFSPHLKHKHQLSQHSFMTFLISHKLEWSLIKWLCCLRLLKKGNKSANSPVLRGTRYGGHYLISFVTKGMNPHHSAHA